MYMNTTGSARPLPVDETAVTGMSTGISCEKREKS